MIVADLRPTRRCYVAEHGRLVHLFGDCGHLADGAARIRAEVLRPDADVCDSCAQRHEPRGPREESLPALLERLDPDEVGVTGFLNH